jgi:putative redox protein
MPMKQPATDVVGETIIIEETKNGPFQLKVRAGSSTFIVDEPIGVGGLGSGPNPYDLLSAALGSCSVMTMRLYASRRKWPLDRIRVKVTHHRVGLDAPDTFSRELQLLGSLSAEQEQKLLEIASHCPVHKTMERGSTVVTSLVSSEDLMDEAVSLCEHMRDMEQACEQVDAQIAES